MKPTETDLYKNAKALLEKIDGMTTDEFAHGGERKEREALRHTLQAIEDSR